MPDVRDGVRHAITAASAHGRHDHLLVARFAVADAYPGETAEARELVERCAECARLAEEIRLLRSVTADIEAPPRPRDFRLTAEQAERLAGSPLERALRRLAAPGVAPIRPLAGVALSIGLVMAVVGTTLPTPASVGLMEVPAEPAPAIEVDRGAGLPAGDRVNNASGEEAPDPPGAEPQFFEPPVAEPRTNAEERMVQRTMRADGAEDPTRSLLFYSGMVIALLSLGVLVVVMLARRRLSDPLLR